MSYILKRGDCRDLLKQVPDNSVDAIITDPPYELNFMNRGWDSTGIAYDVDMWRECYRVCKPGAHLISFGASRTYHRLACAVEDADWQLRDCILWLYGTGFPKSHNLAVHLPEEHRAMWDGWGTALKPAYEPAVLARKPFDTSVDDNVLRYGTGALNIGATRIDYIDDDDKAKAIPASCTSKVQGIGAVPDAGSNSERKAFDYTQQGRWPANLILDPNAACSLDMQVDGASRFFYCAKATREEREQGCEDLPEVRRTDGRESERHVPNLRTTTRRNHHPTVKPISLMRHLVSLITPPGGLVLDPFMGSGTTGIATALEGFRFVGFDLDITNEYLAIAKARIDYWVNHKAQSDAAKRTQPNLFG